MVSMGVSFADTGSEARYSSERFWCLSKKDSEIRGNEGKDLLRQSLCDHGCEQKSSSRVGHLQDRALQDAAHWRPSKASNSQLGNSTIGNAISASRGAPPQLGSSKIESPCCTSAWRSATSAIKSCSPSSTLHAWKIRSPEC